MAEAVDPAFTASPKVQALAAGTTPLERALIRAMTRRYSADPAADRKPLDTGYADGMTEVAAVFPLDDNVQVLLAEC